MTWQCLIIVIVINIYTCKAIGCVLVVVVDVFDSKFVVVVTVANYAA